MKLCLIAPVPPPYGGMANWTVIVTEELDKHSDISWSLINIAANKRPIDGRTIFDRVFYSFYVMLKSYFKLQHLIHADCPDVVHMTTSGGLGFYRDLLLLDLLQRKHIPVVYHLHFGRTVDYNASGGRCWKQLIRCISMADATIVLDEQTNKLLKEYAKTIRVINNPINIDNLSPCADSDERKTVIYLGWVTQAKGISELISGFVDFNRKHNCEYSLLIVGRGEDDYINSMKKIADSNVEFVGEVDHNVAMDLLRKSATLVLPSYTEGFPNVILEAMALKKPVIATKVGAIPQMLSGGAGILINPKDSKEVTDALDTMFTGNTISTMGETAYQKVTMEYDIKPTLEKYYDLWNTVIDTNVVGLRTDKR